MRLKTTRMVLEPPKVDDIPELEEFWGEIDPSVPTDLKLDKEQAWSRLLRFIGHWQIYGYGAFIGRDQRTNKIVGEFGIAHFNRLLDSPSIRRPECFWRVRPSFRNSGYAKEAMVAIINYALKDGSLEGINAMISASNDPSQRLAKSLNFKIIDETIYRNEAVLVMEHSR